MFKLLALSLLMISAVGCGDDKDGDDKSSRKSYSFSADSSVSIESSSLALRLEQANLTTTTTTTGLDNLCTDDQPNLTCVAPSALTGKYFSAGLLIQAGGAGMLAYLLNDEWSAITGSSETYDFDAASPSIAEGSLTCCGGKGDLTGDNVYFSNVAFMFGYLDATFSIPYTTAQEATVSAAMKEEHTIRFVLADDVESGYVRGDLLYKDTDDTFKWSNASGTLSATRPNSPITMNEEVVDWKNPFDDLDDAEIPVIYTEIAESNGKIVTSEDELAEEGRVYSFDFDTTYFIALMVAQSDMSLLQTIPDLLDNIHIQGLPHTDFTFGTAGESELTIK